MRTAQRIIKNHDLPSFDADNDGCEFSASCFTCHLLKCKEDMTPSERKCLHVAIVDTKILGMLADGLTEDEVVHWLGVDPRTLQCRLSRMMRKAV